MAHVFPTRDGFSRRQFMQRSIGGLGGASLCSWLSVLAAQAQTTNVKTKSCILLWMGGGPSHIDTFDPKPKAAEEIRGPIQTISTSVPDIQISELFPNFSQLIKHAAIVRGMSTPEPDHARATYHLHTGYRRRTGGLVYPGLGAIASHELGKHDSDLPNFMFLRTEPRGGNPYGARSGFLGPEHQPMVVNDVQKGVQNVHSATGPEDFAARFDLLTSIEQDFQKTHKAELAHEHSVTLERAVRLMRSPKLKALQISAEPNHVKRAYGDSPFGKSCLMARRLVETGVPFVEVYFSRWDHHSKLYSDEQTGIKGLSAQADAGMSSLVSDLADRGLLESTLIVWMGEFGRTPKIKNGDGRDHWPKAWSLVLAGGGIRGGQVIGKTDSQGASVQERPVSAIELMATICRILGIDYTKELPGPNGRPIPIVDNQQQTPQPIAELFG